MYLDLVMLLNFLVDFLLLMGTNRLTGFPLRVKKCALAGALGAAYAGVCILPGFHFLGNMLWRMVALGAMAGIAFGWERSGLRRAVIFILLSMALGGIAVVMGKGGFFSLILTAVCLVLMARVGLRNDLGSVSYVPVQIRHNGQTVKLTALLDTGNTLRDPVTGSSVLVVEGSIAMGLLGLTEKQLRNPVDALTAAPISGLRLIPYHSVGRTGMLLGYRFSDVSIGKSKGSVLVAFTPEAIGRGEGYQALTGGSICAT